MVKKENNPDVKPVIKEENDQMETDEATATAGDETGSGAGDGTPQVKVKEEPSEMEVETEKKDTVVVKEEKKGKYTDAIR